MILIEIGQPFNQREVYNEILNGEWQKEELEFLFKIKEQAQLRNEKYEALIM